MTFFIEQVKMDFMQRPDFSEEASFYFTEKTHRLIFPDA
jgi:hypothetical protein